MSKDSKKAPAIAMAQLEQLAPADLFSYGKSIVKLAGAVETAKTDFTNDLKLFGKVTAAMKRLYTTKLNAREIPADTSFKKYFEQNAGGSLPGRVEAMASLFNSMVLTVDGNGKPLLSEENYDNAAVDWLEKANAIVKAAQKKYGDAWRTSDDVLDVINALSKPGDAGKALKEIRARQKGEKTEAEKAEDAATALPLTIGRAIEFIMAAILNASTMKEEEAYDLFAATVQFSNAWADSGLSDDALNAFSKKYDTATTAGAAPHMNIITPETETADALEPAAAAA